MSTTLHTFSLPYAEHDAMPTTTKTTRCMLQFVYKFSSSKRSYQLLAKIGDLFSIEFASGATVQFRLSFGLLCSKAIIASYAWCMRYSIGKARCAKPRFSWPNKEAWRMHYDAELVCTGHELCGQFRVHANFRSILAAERQYSF